MTKITEIVAELNAAKQAFREKGETALKTAFKEFFEENPDVKSIYWTQYTPYFNDGDECVFSVNEWYLSTEVDDIDNIDNPEETCISEYNSHPLASKLKAFVKELDPLPDEIYKEVFGDHIRVLATRKGFSTEEYEHE